MVDTSRMTYIVQRKDRFYVVAYDGLNPLTGKERRRRHPVSIEAPSGPLDHRLSVRVEDHLYVIPAIGHVPLRRLRADHVDDL